MASYLLYRCCYITTTLVSIVVAYCVTKFFSAVKAKKEKLKPTDFGTEETAKHGLEIADINETSNLVTTYLCDHTKLSSKPEENLCDALDSLLTLPKQEFVSLSISDTGQQVLFSDASISNQEILASEEAPMNELRVLPSEDSPTSELEILPSEESFTSEFEILPSKEAPTSEFEILPSKEAYTFEFEILPSKEAPASEIEILPSKEAPTSEIENLPPEGTPTSELEIIRTEEASTTELGFSPSVTLTSDLEIIPLETCLPRHKILPSELPTFRNALLSSETLLPKSKYVSVSLIIDELTPLQCAQELKQELDTDIFMKEKNTILSNGLSEIDNLTSMTDSNTDEFSLDIIPLEMIYKIIPMSMR